MTTEKMMCIFNLRKMLELLRYYYTICSMQDLKRVAGLVDKSVRHLEILDDCMYYLKRVSDTEIYVVRAADERNKEEVVYEVHL